MKGRIRLLAVVMFIFVGAPLLVSGCAGTEDTTSTGEYIDDSAITAKVKSKLITDDQVSGFDVQVETFKGVVQLSGFVDTKQAKEQAETLAKSVNGVRDVKNNIIVKG